MWAEAPQLMRITEPSRPGTPLTVHLVGCAAGPLGGDGSEFMLELLPGASLIVRSVAATLAQPGAQREVDVANRPVSTARLTVRVGAGARLDWCPEPLIAVHGCNHRIVTTIDLEVGASLTWTDEVVAGRFGEESGTLWTRQRIRTCGVPVVDHELRVGAEAAGVGWCGSARRIRSTVQVGAAPEAALPIAHRVDDCVREATFAPATGVLMTMGLYR